VRLAVPAVLLCALAVVGSLCAGRVRRCALNRAASVARGGEVTRAEAARTLRFPTMAMFIDEVILTKWLCTMSYMLPISAAMPK
jgi:hypothetical protein